MTGCAPRRAAAINLAQTGAATAPPVRPRTGLVLSGCPTHTAAESTGVAPTNQASAPFSLVPVLPNGPQPAKAAADPVPSATASWRMSTRMPVTAWSSTGWGAGLALYNSRPSGPTTRSMRYGGV